jgi:hypothetical protein
VQVKVAGSAERYDVAELVAAAFADRYQVVGFEPVACSASAASLAVAAERLRAESLPA